MMKLDFTPNPIMRMGAEIEIQLIDPQSGDLKPVGLDILENLKKDLISSRIKPELFQSMLEIDTPICDDAHQVGSSLRESLSLLKQYARKHGAQVMMSGTHPFAHYTERILTQKDRYASLVDRNQWIARRLQIFGLHVHLGMRDGEHAIAMNNALCHYLPMLLAFSASSPFWHGQDTGLASSRITLFESIPTGGHPCLVQSWGEFEKLMERLFVSKSIHSVKDLWWDIRPNLDYGTIEIRITDCPPTIKEVEALVALLHALAVFIDEEISKGRRFSPPPEWMLRENKWRASRHGVQCELIQNLDGVTRRFDHLWQDMKTNLSDIIQRYQYQDLFHFLDQLIVKGPSYQRQRQASGAGLSAVIQNLVAEGDMDMPHWE